MTEILQSASYVRNSKASIEQGQQSEILRSIGERIEMRSEQTTQVWKLLETAQTVETICRSIDANADKSRERVIALLAELYDRDLIQVSPDT